MLQLLTFKQLKEILDRSTSIADKLGLKYMCLVFEEADTRLMLHAKHASQTYSNVAISSPDTDVMVLMMYHKKSIDANLYLCTGAANGRRIININKVHESLGDDMSKGLPGFHAFTGM